MSEPQRFTVERELVNGVEYKRCVPYEPPQFPVRDCVIFELASGGIVMETPGGTREMTVPDQKTGKERKSGKFEPKPYTLLVNPADRMHGTKYTSTEAKERAQRWGFTPQTHKISKQQS